MMSASPSTQIETTPDQIAMGPDQFTMVITSPDDVITTASIDDEENPLSSPGSVYEEVDLMTAAMEQQVTAQLAAAGPLGVAAAAAIVSAKRRRRPHSFETNPSIRKRQQNRLLRKLKQLIEEFASRVGQQAVVLVAAPGKQNANYRVFGTKPLEDIVRSMKPQIAEDLDVALANQAPPPLEDDPTLFELPPLVIDGIPTPVEQMTQAQLRAFIPLMLKYSTGRGKPAWGKESTKPPWWPRDVPWANIRMDARSEQEKQSVSWTHALRQIVINCYTFHGREDLLPAFSEEDERANAEATANAQTVMHASTNADGSVSIVHLDPNNPIITLPDGTTARVQGMATLNSSASDSATHIIQTDEVQGEVFAEATLNQEGQIVLAGADGQTFPVSMNGVITVPMSAYQTMVANIQRLQTGDGETLVNLPLVQMPKMEQVSEDNIETMMVPSGLTPRQMMIQTPGSDTPQLIHVYSLKDATALSGALQRIKTEVTLVDQ